MISTSMPSLTWDLAGKAYAAQTLDEGTVLWSDPVQGQSLPTPPPTVTLTPDSPTPLTKIFSGWDSVAASGAVGPSRVWWGQARQGATVTGSLRSGMHLNRQNTLFGSRVVLRARVARVWKESDGGG